jgi:hypothetical protein
MYLNRCSYIYLNRCSLYIINIVYIVCLRNLMYKSVTRDNVCIV